MQIRRRMMWYPDLPPIYRRVAWLEGLGAQYINTGIIARSGLRAKYEIEFTRTDVIQQVCAALKPGSGSTPRLYFPYADGTTWLFSHGNGGVTTIPGITVNANTRYVVDATMESGNQRIIINGQEYYAGAASTSINTGVSLFLFASNNTNSRRYAYAKIHSFALYDSATEEPLANYIPVVANRGSKPGMYDTVSKVFKTNAGSGEFAVPS